MENFEIQRRFQLLMAGLEYLSYNNYEFIRIDFDKLNIRKKVFS